VNALDELLGRLFTEPAPREVRFRARLVLLDTLGCALAGLESPKLQRMSALLAGTDAAALLATAACWDEACEGLARAHGRPGVPVVAACVGYALQHDLRLEALLDALIVGYEVGGRMGEFMRMRPGMHVDASWPALGVAAAVVRLAGGQASIARSAVEIVASQIPFSLYLPIAQGADGRNTYLGHAAWLGSYAALAALAGCDAPRGAPEEFARLALGIGHSEPWPAGYVLLESYLKPFAAVRHVHYGALAALRLRARIADTSAIHGIELAVYPEALKYCGNVAPRTPLQAQFSLSFGVAAALRFGRLDAEVYRPPAFEDAELRRLERLVKCRAEAFAGREAALELRLADGRFEERVSSIPMSADDCRAKFVRQATPRTGSVVAQAIAEALLHGPEDLALKATLKETIHP
jgi:2-methylcitrate dehydratase PrpD